MSDQIRTNAIPVTAAHTQNNNTLMIFAALVLLHLLATLIIGRTFIQYVTEGAVAGIYFILFALSSLLFYTGSLLLMLKLRVGKIFLPISIVGLGFSIPTRGWLNPLSLVIYSGIALALAELILVKTPKPSRTSK